MNKWYILVIDLGLSRHNACYRELIDVWQAGAREKGWKGLKWAVSIIYFTFAGTLSKRGD